MATELSNGKQTIKLYRSVNRGKTMYQLAFYQAGKRIQRNFVDKAEAKRTANRILHGLALDAEAVDAVATPEIESLIAAKRVLAPNYALHVAVEEHAQAVSKLGKASLREAVEFFLKHHRADVPKISLTELAELYAASRAQMGLTAHYIYGSRKTVLALSQGFPQYTLSDLTTEKLDAWLSRLPLCARSKNDYRCILNACGTWAEGRGYLRKDFNPFKAMMRYKEIKTGVEIFRPDEIKSILQKADTSLIPYLALGAFAGLRPAEIERLDWGEIDLDRGYITVAASKAKTQRRRLVPVAENLKAWLMPLRQSSGSICLHQHPQSAAARYCQGIKWVRNGLRHSYISYRLAVLHDTARVALEAGNSPEIIFAHYRELVTPEEAQQWFAVKPE